MKKIILPSVLALLAVSCAQKGTDYTIQGDAPAFADNTMVVLTSTSDYEHPLDTAYLVGGKFQFTRPYQADAAQAALMLTCMNDNDQHAVAILFAEAGQTLNVHLDTDEAKTTVEGGKLNAIYTSYRAAKAKAEAPLVELSKQLNNPALTPEERKALNAQGDSLYGIYQKVDETFCRENITNLVGATLLGSAGFYFDMETKKELLAAVPAELQQNMAITELKKEIDTLDKTAIGKPMTDFEMADPAGNLVKLSQFTSQNKFTIVDFWASWCGPCRREIPFMKQLLADYKAKGLGMVGVSFDSSKDAWLKAIADEKLDYPHMSDLKGWDCLAGQIYYIRAIPATMVVSQDGTIVSRDLRGEELKAKIAELLK